jgi:hypothetical protein
VWEEKIYRSKVYVCCKDVCSDVKQVKQKEMQIINLSFILKGAVAAEKAGFFFIFIFF